jgi:signal transduction histidine kinase
MIRSLSTRLLIWLVGAQIILVIIAMLLFPLLAPYTTYSEIAEYTARHNLLASLRRGDQGQISFEPSETWVSYKGSRPSLEFALFDLDEKRIVASSSENLRQAALTLSQYPPREEGTLASDLSDRPGDTLVVTMQSTPVGRFLVLTTGNAFGSEDAASYFKVFAPAVIPMYAPIVIGALFAIPVFVRRILAPLDALAQRASLIDVSRTSDRLPERDLEVAFLPLIKAINGALDRLDRGFARQKLYAANSAHEMRTPLAILRARLDTLPETSLKVELQRDTMRIGTLVEQMLTISRLGQREVNLDERVDLVALVRGVVADRAPLVLRANKAIAFRNLTDHERIIGNAQSIASAVANLIDNAIRAEPDGGTVEVSVLSGGIVEVSDHGPGINPEDRDVIFEPFWRKDELPPGTGLGLAIVREVMIRHGGDVSIEETCGGGATFLLRFRLSEAAT